MQASAGLYVFELAVLPLMPVALPWNDALESLQPLQVKQGAEQDFSEVWAAYAWQGAHLCQEISACGTLAPGIVLNSLDSEFNWDTD